MLVPISSFLVVQMTDKQPDSRTDRLNGEALQDMAFIEPEVVYQPIPDPAINVENRRGKPVWRVRFDLGADPSIRFGLDINDEIILGRGADAQEPSTMERKIRGY